MKIMNKLYGLIALLAFLFTACNKNGRTELTSPVNRVDTATTGKKVLMVIVDGLVGSELKAVAPVNITSFAKNAVFSYDALNTTANDRVSNPYGWTTLLTGVEAMKHKVYDDFTNHDLKTYPSMVSRLKALRPSFKTSAITTQQEFADHLMTDAYEKWNYANMDAQAIIKASETLAKENNDFTIVQLSGVDSAGMAAEFLASNPLYAKAITKTDAYIAQLIEVIRARQNYDSEDWMIVITSGKGSNTRMFPSPGKAWNAFNDAMHNGFIMFYNPRFIPAQYSKFTSIIPYAGQTQLYSINGTDAGNGAYVPASVLGNKMDFGPQSEFTMQCKVKFPKIEDGLYYPAFLGKMQEFSGDVPGFLFYFEGDTWAITLRPVGGGRTWYTGGMTNDGAWHTLTAVIQFVGGQRKVFVYTDGVLSENVGTISANASFINDADFTVGWKKELNFDDAIKGKITDIRVYNTALSATYISNNYCATVSDPSDTATRKLVAFWPSLEIMTNGSQKYFQDYSQNGFPLTIKSVAAENFSDMTSNVCAAVSPLLYRNVPNNVDVAYQIYNWFGFPAPSSWNLDGKAYVPKYIDVSN